MSGFGEANFGGSAPGGDAPPLVNDPVPTQNTGNTNTGGTVTQGGQADRGSGVINSSAQQVYNALRAAGASPEEAAALTAISGAESGWRAVQSGVVSTSGRREPSFGYFQVNMDAHQGASIPGSSKVVSPTTMSDLGLASAYALQLYRDRGPRPWSVTFDGRLSGSDVASAEAAATAAGDVVSASTIWSNTTGGVRGTTGGSISAIEGGGSFGQGVEQGGGVIPPGGKIYGLPDGSWVVRYQVAPGVFIEYDTNDAQALKDAGYKPRTVDRSRLAEYDENFGVNHELLSYQETGDLTDLEGILEESGAATIQEWYEETFTELWGSNQDAANDPGIQRLVLEMMGNPDISQGRIRALLEDTQFWKDTNSAENEWRDLSPAEQEVRIQNAARDLAKDHRRIMGLVDGSPVSMNDPNIMQFAEQYASGQITYGAILSQFEEAALQVEDSPFFRETRSEDIATRQFGVDTENLAFNLGEQMTRWGVTLPQASVDEWAQAIMMNESSQADFENVLEQQASILYPNRPAGMRTLDWAQPWMNALSRTLEIGIPNLNDDRIQQALQSGMNVFDFNKQLMQTEDWMFTQNAQDSLTNAFSQASELMGFN